LPLFFASVRKVAPSYPRRTAELYNRRRRRAICQRDRICGNPPRNLFERVHDVVKLSVENVSVARGDRTILAGLSFSVAAGEALLLTGPNGAGKTTLLRAIAGLIGLSAGAITLEGGAADRSIAEQAHYAAHSNALKGSLTVAENLAFWGTYLGGASGSDLNSAVDAALDALDLDDLADVPAAYMSAGQKRRAGLARILMAKRPLWLLDEPTVSLDSQSVEIVARLINAHTAGGGLALVATHLPLALTAPRSLTLEPLRAMEAA
jgi:heme exporter protein A